jgi:hypothetical protein
LIAALIFGRVHRSHDLCRPAAVDCIQSDWQRSRQRSRLGRQRSQ